MTEEMTPADSAWVAWTFKYPVPDVVRDPRMAFLDGWNAALEHIAFIEAPSNQNQHAEVLTR